MADLQWDGPYLLRDWILSLLDGAEIDPPEKAGVYAVSRNQWQGQPEEKNKVLYVGCSANLLGRIHDLVPMLLGLYNKQGKDSPKEIGRHPGWKIFGYCSTEGIKVGSLYIGWATTESKPCYGCAEVDLVRKLKPKSQKGTSRVACCCT